MQISGMTGKIIISITKSFDNGSNYICLHSYSIRLVSDETAKLVLGQDVNQALCSSYIAQVTVARVSIHKKR